MAKILTIENICQITDRLEFAKAVEKYYKREKKNKVLSEKELAQNLSYILINHISKDSDWAVLIYLDDLLKIAKIDNSEELKNKLLDFIDNDYNKYFALKCYAYLVEKESYEKLLSVIFNKDEKLEERALAVKLISNISKQTFDLNLPSDPGYWKEEDLRLDDIKHWQDNGMADGEGYKPPKQDDSLFNPVTKLEKVASRLQKRISKYRSNEPSIQNEYLVVADENMLSGVLAKYELNGTYLEFLKRFSPQDVSYYRAGGQYRVYGVSDILNFQLGYSVDDKGNKLEGWPENYLVIADKDSDPYCIDLSENDGSVYFAYHGEGEWNFEKVYENVIEFISELAR
ncbi:MAG: SMI1/KNR4 family protein [Clostridia bacterium]|nr:SMI1/KNR4 family protein [Clostridia bacterium]